MSESADLYRGSMCGTLYTLNPQIYIHKQLIGVSLFQALSQNSLPRAISRDLHTAVSAMVRVLWAATGINIPWPELKALQGWEQTPAARCCVPTPHCEGTDVCHLLHTQVFGITLLL